MKIYKFLSRLVKLFGSLLCHGETILVRYIRRYKGEAPRATCVVLCYHAVASADRARFAQQMDVLLQNAKPIRPDFTGQLTPGERFVSVTFDDGHQSVVANALPELQKRKIPCAIFVISHLLGQSAPWSGLQGYNYDDKYVTESELPKLSCDLVIIGSHSSTHRMLSTLSEPEAKQELQESRDFLGETLGQEVRLFAFPNGRHNESVIRWSKEAGYQRVFTVEPVTAFSEPSEYVTGRVPVDPTDWPIEFRLKMLGAYRWLAPVFEWRDQIRGKLGNRSRITTGNLARTRIQSAFKAAAQNSLLNEERRDDELVTAVIPTRNRPDMLLRAVRSALNQDYRHLEVVVVVDGPDPATNSVLQSISDPRLRVVSLPEPQGGSAARNAGVLAAHGAWIAFLDDDDEWLPSKISKQIECARMSRAKRPIVSCQLIARTRGKELIWPRKTPSHPVSEYLLSRSSWSYGEGILSTITLFMPRSLLLEVPFTLGLPRYQDLEWILRALDRPGVSIEFISEPLAIWHMADGLNSVSSALNLDFSLNWIRSHRERVTQRAYSGFIATQVAPQAARQNRWKTFFPLLLDMFRNGRPTSFHIALYLSMWFTPHWLRRYVRLAQR